jgi:hypothetical protein
MGDKNGRGGWHDRTGCCAPDLPVYASTSSGFAICGISVSKGTAVNAFRTEAERRFSTVSVPSCCLVCCRVALCVLERARVCGECEHASIGAFACVCVGACVRAKDHGWHSHRFTC